MEDVLSHKKVFAFIPPFVESKKNSHLLYVPNLTDEHAKLSRLMLYLARTYWNKCPLPLLNVVRNENIDRNDFLGDYEDIAHVFEADGISDFNRTSFIRFLDKLKSDGLVESLTYKRWLLKYGKQGEIESCHKFLIERSTSQIFPLTAMGTIMYEYIINTPTVFMSYLSAYFEPVFPKKDNNDSNPRSQNRYNTGTSPLVNLSIALRTERLSLFVDSPFQYKSTKSLSFHQYHDTINNEQSDLLGNYKQFFIDIHNPATKILREIRALVELANFYDLKKATNLKNKNYSSEELLERLFKLKIQNDIKLLEDIWVNLLGLPQHKIKLHLPDVCI